MLFLALLLMQSSLPRYEITIDPVFLEQLYADPFLKLEFPASVSLDGKSSDCLVSFRGGTSLWCKKLSWHIHATDQKNFPCGGHILLNAQFRDPSLMRNSLGLYITRKLGFPAPETEFVTFSVNNKNKGVYERVERIDRLFYERNGLSFGPLFKNTDTLGRLSHHYSDTTGLAGYEPKVDSYPYGNQLLELIEACFRGDSSLFETHELLAAFAVNAAIGDNDGIIKNFYLHRSNGIWHYYPWDRDATFGNTWKGVYQSDWVGKEFLIDMGYFGATRGILTLPENIDEFNRILSRTGSILEELPAKVDSIRLLIRNELAADPYYEFNTSQFDSLCAVLMADVQKRADFIADLQLNDRIPKIENISISSCLDMKENTEIKITLNSNDSRGVVCLLSVDGEREQWLNMTPDGHSQWLLDFTAPSGTYCIHLAFGPFGSNDLLPVFFPAWGIREYHQRPDPTPSARVALADLYPHLLSPGIPVWCGENLWVLPVKNTSSESQDLSLCRFSLGETAGNVFLAESTLVAPGETFYLTNFHEEAEAIYKNFNIYGNAGTIYPAKTTLELFDPSWNSLYSWHIGAGDSLFFNSGNIIPSEISAGDANDWIELFNYSESTVDISHWYLKDSDNNISLIPDGTTIAPRGILLNAVDPASFDQALCKVVSLDFGIDSKTDSLSLYSRFGDLKFCLYWNTLWPLEETGVMYLKSPMTAFTFPKSWEAAMWPGSPGEVNPGWSHNANYASIALVSENPCDGSFTFHYKTSTVAEALLYDLTGRVTARIGLPASHEGDVTADFSKNLPNGVYILYLKSSTSSASTRLTILN